MEETVRNLLQSQGPPEQKTEDTVNIMVYQVHHGSYSQMGTDFLIFSSSVLPNSERYNKYGPDPGAGIHMVTSV